MRGASKGSTEEVLLSSLTTSSDGGGGDGWSKTKSTVDEEGDIGIVFVALSPFSPLPSRCSRAMRAFTSSLMLLFPRASPRPRQNSEPYTSEQ